MQDLISGLKDLAGSRGKHIQVDDTKQVSNKKSKQQSPQVQPTTKVIHQGLQLSSSRDVKRVKKPDVGKDLKGQTEAQLVRNIGKKIQMYVCIYKVSFFH